MKKFKVGDTVVVKQGVKDPDFDTDLSGWYGRITNIDPQDSNMLEVGWDSGTLKNMPQELITACIQEGLDISLIILEVTEVEPAQPRDTPEETLQVMQEILSENILPALMENEELVDDFFARAADLLEDDWDLDDVTFDEEGEFDIEEFFTLLEIPLGEQDLITDCLAQGLYDYYQYIYGFDKYGTDLHWLISERMYEPFIFGFGTVEILKNPQISHETKDKIIVYTLSLTNPNAEYGIPHGLPQILQYLAERKLLDIRTFNVIMITLQTLHRDALSDLEFDGWLTLSDWIIKNEELESTEKVWWIWHLSTKIEEALSASRSKKIVSFWLDNPDISLEAKNELCWAWVTETTEVGTKPVMWRLMDAQLSGDVKGVKESLQTLGASPAEIAATLRFMEQAQAEIHDNPLGVLLGPGLNFMNFILIPTWLKRLAVLGLVRFGEDPLDVSSLLLDHDREYGSEGINKGVADVLSQYHDRIPPAQLRRLIEKGLQIPQVSTRKTFYQLSTQFYGDEYLKKTQEDNAASLRKWGAKKLNQ